MSDRSCKCVISGLEVSFHLRSGKSPTKSEVTVPTLPYLFTGTLSNKTKQKYRALKETREIILSIKRLAINKGAHQHVPLRGWRVPSFFACAKCRFLVSRARLWF